MACKSCTEKGRSCASCGDGAASRKVPGFMRPTDGVQKPAPALARLAARPPLRVGPAPTTGGAPRRSFPAGPCGGFCNGYAEQDFSFEVDCSDLYHPDRLADLLRKNPLPRRTREEVEDILDEWSPNPFSGPTIKDILSRVGEAVKAYVEGLLGSLAGECHERANRKMQDAIFEAHSKAGGDASLSDCDHANRCVCGPISREHDLSMKRTEIFGKVVYRARDIDWDDVKPGLRWVRHLIPDGTELLEVTVLKSVKSEGTVHATVLGVCAESET